MPGVHYINEENGGLMVQYTEAEHMTQLREYYVEVCQNTNLLVYRVTETVQGNSAPVFASPLDTNLVMLSNQERTIELPDITVTNPDAGEVLKEIRVIDVGKSRIYKLNIDPEGSPVELFGDRLIVTPSYSALTQIFIVEIILF